MPIDPKVLAELKAKFPDDVHKLGMPKGMDGLMVLVRTPPLEAWDRMQDRILDPRATTASKRAAANNLLMDCLLYPTRGELEHLIEKKPGLLQTLSNQLTQIAGVENELQAEKL